MTWVCYAFGNVYICSSYQRGMRPILHHIDISSTLQRTEVIFMENIQSAKVTNPTIIRQKDLPYVVKIKYSCAIFKSHENNAWLPRREKKISKCGSLQLTQALNLKKKTKKNKTNSPMLSEASAPIEVNVTAVAGSTSNVLEGRSTSIVLDRRSKARLSTSKAALVPTAGWGSTSKAMMAAWASSQMMIQSLPAFGNCSFTRMLDVFLLIEDDCNVF